MGRPERPLDANSDPVAAFAFDLRELRKRAGNPTYRELARSALFAPSVLSSAASGHRLPTLPVVLAFVTSCGGDPAVWERRWRELVHGGAAAESRPVPARLFGKRPAASAPTGSVPVPVPALAPAEADSDTARLLPAPTRPAQLPLTPTTFVGRVAELDAATAIVTVTGRMKVPLIIGGPVGVGKTAFALRLAAEAAREFPDGQLYADLGASGPGSPSPDSVMTGFLCALGVPAAEVPQDRLQRIGLYRSLLAQRRLFVLLENAYDESQIRPLLCQSPHTQFVVTSSARLLGLDGMHRVDLSMLARQDSVALLCRLAGTDRIEAEDESADAIAEVCGDLPLALNIIGRKLAARSEWTLGHAARLLADRNRLMDVLSVGDVSARERYASAYRLLPSLCRRTLQLLGGLGLRRATALDVAAALGIPVVSADEMLESLVDSGLIIRADEAGRYGIPELVSAYAASTPVETAGQPPASPRLVMRNRVQSSARSLTG
jgi:hypothetical protein